MLTPVTRNPTINRRRQGPQHRKSRERNEQTVSPIKPPWQKADSSLRGQDQQECDFEPLAVVDAPGTVPRSLHMDIASCRGARPPRFASAAEDKRAEIDG